MKEFPPCLLQSLMAWIVWSPVTCYISPNFSRLDVGQPLVVDFPDFSVFEKVLANNFAPACIVVVKLWRLAMCPSLELKVWVWKYTLPRICPKPRKEVYRNGVYVVECSHDYGYDYPLSMELNLLLDESLHRDMLCEDEPFAQRSNEVRDREESLLINIDEI